jgi:hypothetical protein
MAEPDAELTVFDHYVAALSAGDLEAILPTLAPDVVLSSPIIRRVRFEGDAVRELFEVLFTDLGITEVEVLDQLAGEQTGALFHRAKVGGVRIEEATRLRFGDDGRVARITLYIRPLSGLLGLLARLGPKIAARRGRSWLAGRSGR